MLHRLIPWCLALVMGAPTVASAKCKTKGKSPEVYVNGKTPIRRGPGLNYPVASFLERGTCAPYSELSIDKSWVLVDIKNKLGWVPTSRLSAKSQERVAGIKVESAPVGSGQDRAYANITKQSVLLDAPNARASARRVLPQGVRVLPLAKTEDGLWVQIRDERGDVGWIPTSDLAGPKLADLPNADLEATNVVANGPNVGGGEGTRTSTRAGNRVVGGPGPSAPSGDAIMIDAAVFGAALLPTHSLDSDGNAVQRRYNVASFTPGTGVEIGLSNIGPITFRVKYIFGLLVGVAQEDKPNVSVGGMQHDVAARIGFPIEAGDATITPEVGYALGMFDIDPVVPGGPRGQTFVSSQTHAGTAGGRVQYLASPTFMIEGAANLLAGVTSEGPGTLGQAGLTFGAVAAAGARFAVTDTVGLVAQYALNYRTTSFDGRGSLDASIQSATLTDFTHGLLVGVGFRFAAE